MLASAATQWRNDRFRKYTLAPVAHAPLRAASSLHSTLLRPYAASPRPLFSSDASYADQVSKNYAFQGLRGCHPGVAAAPAYGRRLQPAAVFVKCERVPPARVIVEIQLHADPGLGVAQLQFAGPWRHSVFIRPDLKQHQLVAVLGQILQCSFTVPIIQKIRDDDHQPALRIGPDEFLHRRKIIRGAGRLQVGKAVHHSRETVAPPGGNYAMRQAVAEALNLYGVQAHQADIAQRPRQFPRVIELHSAVPHHAGPPIPLPS